MAPKLLSVILLFFMLSSYTLAFGLASSYLKENTMRLYAGESKEYKIELQNSEEKKIRAQFVLEEGIAEVTDKKEFYMLGGDAPFAEIMLKVNAPKEAKIGDIYTVKYNAMPLFSLNIIFPGLA
jgi:hypothetical protein